MSRISQTLSLLGNLSSFSAGSDIASEVGKDDITEQFLPRRQDAVFGDQFIFQTTALRQPVNARLVLLAPLPCGVPPFAKSVMYLSSLSGPVTVTVANVKVTLPSFFRGVVNVKDHDGFCRSRQTRYCRAFRDRINRGLIRLDSYVLENEDEVYIHAEGDVQLRLISLGDEEENIGSRVGRHVRRIFGTT